MCLLHAQVFVPYALCLSVRESVTVCACVGGLALAVACVVLCALSLSPRATYLFVAHLRYAGPDIGVCQQREKQGVGNWVTYSVQGRGEGKASMAINKQEQRGRGGNGQKDSIGRGGKRNKK